MDCFRKSRSNNAGNRRFTPRLFCGILCTPASKYPDSHYRQKRNSSSKEIDSGRLHNLLILNEKRMVPRAGIEPTTHCLEGSCSIL